MSLTNSPNVESYKAHAESLNATRLVHIDLPGSVEGTFWVITKYPVRVAPQ
jgi:hypothetical protein